LSSRDKSPIPELPVAGSEEGDASPQRSWACRPTGRALVWIVLALSLLTVPNSCRSLTRRVRLVVNGIGREIHTRQATVMGVLEEAGVVVCPEDAVYPAPTKEVTWGQIITLRQACWARVAVDGQVHRLRIRADSALELLKDMGVLLRSQDRLLVNGQRVSDAQMPRGSPLTADSRQVTSRGPRPVEFPSPPPLQVVVERAVPLYVHDENGEYRTLSAAKTVGEALHEAQISIYRGDRVEPSLDSPLTAGTRVLIERAIPLTIQVDESILHTRTRGDSVADVLAEEQLSLWDQDYVVPAESAPLSPNLAIRVVRVREETIVEQETIDFETEWGPSAEVELDQERMVREGHPGIIARRFRIRYEDGQVIARTLQEEWRAQEPQSRFIGYGTKIVSRQVDTPNGPLSYWRKIRVYATAYTAATSGKSRDHPEYGITRLGWRMRWGIIAVDPRVINFNTRIYVPGYGVGVSGDTGGKILGRHIDLGYDETNLKHWYWWTDAYLLDPPPPRHRIRWVLPDWPKER
jgi:uncharacterized protein YabE (DUF348 family)